MGKKISFKQRIRQICLYTTLTAIVVGGLAMVRFLALSFVFVRYVLFFLLTKAIAHLVSDCKEGSFTVATVIAAILNYLVEGFLFGFRTVNNTIADHWIAITLTYAGLLAILVYADLQPKNRGYVK